MLDENEITQLQIACNDLREMPLFVDDTPGMTVLELRAKVRRLWLQQKISAVIVDYLQLMHTPGSDSRQQEIAEISRGPKALAREPNIPAMALAQPNRPPHGREGNPPPRAARATTGPVKGVAGLAATVSASAKAASSPSSRQSAGADEIGGAAKV